MNGASDFFVEVFGENGKHISNRQHTRMSLIPKRARPWEWLLFPWECLSKSRPSWKFSLALFVEETRQDASVFFLFFLLVSSSTATISSSLATIGGWRLAARRTSWGVTVDRFAWALNASRSLANPSTH